MNCPHCQGRLPAHRPVTHPNRFKLYAHHGEMDVDAEQMRRLMADAKAYHAAWHKLMSALRKLEVYQEVTMRLERDPAFARHVFAYDGDGGGRFFPGASREAEKAEILARLKSGTSRKDDLMRYMELMMQR